MTIPASQVVNVIPGVLGAGGTGLTLNGIMLTANTRVPIGTVPSFPTQAAVAAYFGATSAEAALATNYFSGYIGATQSPGSLLFYQYPWAAPVGAYARGTSLAALTLANLQALSGSLVAVIDGSTHTAASIDLSSATSFSNAAQLIQAGLGIVGHSKGTITGAISATTLTVSADSGVVIAIGDQVTGAGVTADTFIQAFGSGTGGAGTYTVSQSQTVASETLTIESPAVYFDSVSSAFVINSATTGTSSTIATPTGTLAAGIGMSAPTLSQGAAIATPAAAMAQISNITQNWAAFMTVFEPVLADKLLFAGWVNGQNNRFAYIAWDTDSNACVSNNTTCLGAVLTADAYSGTIPISGYAADIPVSTTLAAVLPPIAAFTLGTIAAINFGQLNGRITFKFRSQSGLVPSCTDVTTAAILDANGYNFYGSYATSAQGFVFFAPGSISGIFLWADTYVNQIWLNNAIQLALVELLTNIPSVPYNQTGYTMIKTAVADPINAALNFGAIRAGVELSAAQKLELNNAAGLDIATTVQNVGWYLQVKDPGAQARAARTTPACTFWYTDGGAVQQITLASIDVL